ncbi:MAG: dihydrodipicolinate synthase family protein [Phycisphaerae bacterium]|nr:dihydrodipicolinate synthase family protein [Gemmatimonadaceae bacterium]
MSNSDLNELRAALLRGMVIPAHPLALTDSLSVDEKHQRALTRYYVAAGAGGMAVGVHTTGFPIHDVKCGLYEPVLALAAETADLALSHGFHSPDQQAATGPSRFVRVAGLVGNTANATREAGVANALGYHCGLLSLGAWRDATSSEVLAHCREVASAIPLFGFYLQPAVGGRVLDYAFWREFAEIPQVVAIKVAPFNRYATLDVMRAVADSGRTDIALYTGNDDSIVGDLLLDIAHEGANAPHFVGGLLGQWAVWTQSAVQLLNVIRPWRASGSYEIPREWLTYGTSLTEANAAIFDVAHGFAGCLPGILEVLRVQGLVRNTLTLDEHERLSPGQTELIAAARARFPALNDDRFVSEHLDEWLR